MSTRTAIALAAVPVALVAVQRLRTYLWLRAEVHLLPFPVRRG